MRLSRNWDYRRLEIKHLETSVSHYKSISGEWSQFRRAYSRWMKGKTAVFSLGGSGNLGWWGNVWNLRNSNDISLLFIDT